MINNPSSIENRFLDATRMWLHGHTHALYSVFALKRSSDPILICAKILLGTYPDLSTYAEMDHQTEHIHVYRKLVLLGKLSGNQSLEGILDSALKGEVHCLPRSYAFPVIQNHTLSSYMPPDSTFGDGRGKIARTLFINGPQHEEYFRNSAPPEKLDVDIKTNLIPYDGLQDVLGSAGLSSLFTDRGGCSIQITALAPASIMEDSSLRLGDLCLRVSKSIVLKRDQISIGYVIHRKGKVVDRGRILGRDLEWEERAEGASKFDVGTYKAHFADALSAKLFLSYGSGIYDEELIEDEAAQINTLAATYTIYDNQTSALIQHLDGKGKEASRDFESAIHQLLSLSGFASVHLGANPLLKPKDTVDVVATTRSGRLLVVECTLKDLNNENKIAKLDARYKHILAELKTAKVPIVESLRVIATSYRREQVESEFALAENHEIAVLARDNIQVLLDSLGSDHSSDAVFDFIKRLIPHVPKADELNLWDLTAPPTSID